MSKMAQKDRETFMATGNTFELIVKFSIPTIMGMLATGLYTVIDRAFVGNIPGGEGQFGLAAITICMPITTIIFAISMLAGAGGGANISLNMGRGNMQKAEKFIGNGFILGVLISFIVSLFTWLFLDPILVFFGASETVLPYAKTFLRVILLGSTINTISFCLNRYILAQGFAAISMATMLLSVFLNMILSPTFIFVFGWGIAGAAWGSVLGQLAAATWVFYYLIWGKTPLKLKWKYMMPDAGIMKDIIFLGVSPSVLQLAISFVQTITNNSLKAYGGDVSMAVMGIVSAIMMVISMPIFGINQGVQPVIGFNYGAEHYDRVRRLLMQTMATATVVITTLWLILMIFTRHIITIFAPGNEALMNEGIYAIRTYLFALPVVGVQIIGGNYFQSIGKPVHSMLLTLSRQVLLLAPALLILPRFLGLHGVYLSGPVSDLLSTILTAILLIVEIRHLGRQKNGVKTLLENNQ